MRGQRVQRAFCSESLVFWEAVWERCIIGYKRMKMFVDFLWSRWNFVESIGCAMVGAVLYKFCGLWEYDI